MRQLHLPVALLAALLAAPAGAQWFVDSSAPAAGGGGACTDYTGSMVALWHLEETSGTRVNDTGTTCGSDCNLLDNNTVTSGTGKEGTNAASFDVANDEYLDCNKSTTCEEIETGAMESSAWSYGMWLNADVQNTQSSWIFMPAGENGSSLLLYENRWGTPNYEVQCFIPGGTNAESDTAIEVGAWHHYVCAWANDADDEVNIYYDGEAQTAGSLTTNLTFVAEQEDTRLSRSGVSGFDGLSDEVFVTDVELTAAQACYICSCGVDGLLCTGTTTYTDSGRNTADCGSCTLPDCDAVAP